MCIVIVSLVSLAFYCATRKAVISVSSTDSESSSRMIISYSFCTTAAIPVSRYLNRLYSTSSRQIENGYIIVVSISVFRFPPETSRSYIRMVVVPMGRCRFFVSVLVPHIFLMQIGNIPVSLWSIHFVVSC